MFAELLHIPPWRIGDLSRSEFADAVAYFEERVKQAEEAAKQNS